MPTPQVDNHEGVPPFVLCFIGWLLFLSGFITGVIANGFTVHLRP